MRLRGMIGVAVLSTTFIVTGVAAADASPAVDQDFAAFARIYAKHGSDYASTTGTWVEACDIERDGNGVYGEFWYGSTGHTQVWDGNGSDGGCGNATLAGKVTRFKVCEDHVGCSDMVYTDF
ncbi:hypothetical protein [Amycolatopsis sp. NPDC059657]|uniref:hypothetical protein n=1 Tax=Amycolatopsis sp. NPDC059657 TaxID=3346899 RepID=UPI00366F3CCD